MPNSEELKPCPFCLSEHVTDRHVRDGRQMFCQNCGASVAPTYHGPHNDTIARATVAWNTRAHPTPTAADTRVCTCHPDDKPPVPCAKKYALTDCLAAAADTGLTVGERMAFKAGWMTNASLEQPHEYLDGCEKVDCEEYEARGLSGYLDYLALPNDEPAAADTGLVERLTASTRDCVTGEPLHDDARPDLYVDTVREVAAEMSQLQRELADARQYHENSVQREAAAREQIRAMREALWKARKSIESGFGTVAAIAAIDAALTSEPRHD